MSDATIGQLFNQLVEMRSYYWQRKKLQRQIGHIQLFKAATRENSSGEQLDISYSRNSAIFDFKNKEGRGKREEKGPTLDARSLHN